jgi:pimeloyl-ACP methyl ester carboxylesterase
MRYAGRLIKVLVECYMPTLRIRSTRCQTALFVTFLFVLTSCSLLRLREEVKQIEAHGVALLEVDNTTPGVATYAVAWMEHDDATVTCIGLHPLGGTGVAYFLLQNGRKYHLGAFADLNGNGRHDAGEPSGSVANVMPQPLVAAQEPREAKVVHLSASHTLPAAIQCAAESGDSPLGEALKVHLGEIASLDEERFNTENAQRGMWQPFEFLVEQGVGTYFLEPFDAKRLPVLFVHGLAAGPQDFTALAEGLDHEHCQVWVFHYPSGFSLDEVANTLAGAIARLHETYEFDRLAVVAHSLGGLIARDAICRVADRVGKNLVPTFVSISAPWGGHQAATIGVNHLSYPVPAWCDLVPESAYLASTLAKPLPQGTTHHLMFGFHSSSGLGLPTDNDGVVGVESQLLPSMQASAATVFGLPFEHHDILDAEQVVKRIARLVLEAAR